MKYFLRHGKDDESFVGGWSDGELTEEGRDQIKKAAIFIKEHLDIRRIISSDLARARETALLINEVLNVKIIYDARLREKNKGVYNGIKVTDAKKMNANYKMIENYPGGECEESFKKRVQDFLSGMKENELYITHRGVIKEVYNQKKESLAVISHASIHKYSRHKIRKIY